MSNKSTNESDKLYENQLILLQILYKFRFGTNILLAKYRGVHRYTINESLLTLLEHGYIERKYDKSKKIKGESAVYFLTTKGVNYLKQRFTLANKIVNTMFKNQMVSNQFIEHTLSVFNAYLLLQAQYHDKYRIFTKSELAKFDQYPKQLPDLFLTSKTGQKDYMLDLYLHEPFFVIKKRIKAYIEHRNEDWDDSTPYPSILLVCPDARNEEKVSKYCESQLEDFDFFVTTTQALLDPRAEKAIWTNPVEPDELIRL